MDPIRQAFSLIKQEIQQLKQQILEIQQQINTSKPQQSPQNTPTMPNFNQTIPTQNPTQHPQYPDTPTHIPTHQHPIQPPKPSNLPFSIGNEGVPTDKPTDRQTNQQTDNWPKNTPNRPNLTNFNDFERVNEILDNLDNIKKDIRLKFKRLTPQEMIVFTTLYGLEEQNIHEITYKLIANNLNLSESSIRDYINKLINKGIPILKIRQNNKKITLTVSSDLKNIATLATIVKLRDL